jgi:tRNA A-37 threonylcarbamoyl transferase component Bud32
VAGSLRDVLSNIRGKEEEVHDIEEDMSSKLSGDVSQQDLQAAAQEGGNASELLEQITNKLSQLFQRNGEDNLQEIKVSTVEAEEEIRHEVEDPDGFKQEVEEVEQTLGKVDDIMDVIDLEVRAIEQGENTVKDLEKDELQLFSEVQDMATEVRASGADSNIRNAAQHIFATDKSAVWKTAQLFRVGRELADSLEKTIEELRSALQQLERKLNTIQIKVSSQQRKEKIKDLIAKIEGLRDRMKQQEQRIESVNWDKLENESLTLKERMEKAGSWEELTGGMTNEVQARGDDVLKKFERSKTQLFQALGNVPSGEFEVPTVEGRIQSEQRFRQIYGWLQENREKIPVELPEIKEKEGNRVRVERIQGKPLNKYLNSKNSVSEAKELGEKVGLFTKRIHDNNIAITDFRINNFIVKKNENLAIVDVEYANLDASSWQKRYMDLITMASSARQVKPEAYRNFMDGFKKEYGEVGVLQKAIAAVTSKGHAAALETDKNRTANAFKNTANTLKFWN